jgi:twinkle protein
MDITEIKRRLADRAQDVAAMLLPHGRKEAAEWRAGSTDGDKGQSLGVHLSGQKAGVWADFATGETGDLLDLWCASKRIPLSEAMEAARGYLGIQRHEPYHEPKPAYVRPPKPQCVKPKARVLDYLTEERNIPREIIDLYRIAEDGDRIVFPFLLSNGELVLVKTREAKDGAAPKPTAANCEPILFGWQAVPENAREVTITEGEIDACSMRAYGFAALSVPFGGGGGKKQQWIENDFERLERFERINLALDMDKPGDEAAAEIASRLGRHRCFRVKLPRKDANECLVDGVSHETIAQCVKEAEGLDPEGLRLAGAYADKIVRLFWPHEGEHQGYSLPYSGIHRKLLFRPGEVTLWSGSSGSGKSQIISDCVPKWVQEGSRVCIASFEMKPEWTLKRMVKQTGGVDRPSEPFIRDILGFLDAGVLLYERVGKSDVNLLLEIFDYARAKYGCDQFVIDSLMRLGIAGDDYTGQEQVVFKLVDWAIARNVHLHLVAHSRKGERDRGAPETEDIKGAMEIGANAFNILTIWRDRRHEEDLRAAQTADERKILDEKPGVILNVAKQRNGDFEGRLKLWFSVESYQYYSATDNRRFPRNYIRRLNEEKAA